MAKKSEKGIIALRIIYFGSTLAVFLYYLNLGWGYYTTPIEERFFSDLHGDLKASGIVGHGLGVFGSVAMIVGMGLYMLRKRVGFMQNWGSLRNWLEFHIFLCVMGPLLILLHTTFKFGGLVATSFWSMVAVAVSGVFGRFIYTRIPRTIKGKELGFKELIVMNKSLTHELKEKYAVPDSVTTMIDNFVVLDEYKNIPAYRLPKIMLTEYFNKFSLIRKIKAKLKEEGMSSKSISDIIKHSKVKLKLVREIGMLHSFQKLFKYWHVIHLPFALVMLIIMVIHIFVTYLFGYRWIL